MCQHIFSGCDIGEEYAVQIDVDHFVPLVVSHFFGGGVDTDSGVVVAEIKSAELVDDLLYHSVHMFRAGAVASDCDHFSARTAGKLRGCLFRLVNVEIHDRNVRACLGKRGSGALADASRPAGNKSLFSVKFHFFDNSHDYPPFN